MTRFTAALALGDNELVKPNLKELERALVNRDLTRPDDARKAARRISAKRLAG